MSISRKKGSEKRAKIARALAKEGLTDVYVLDHKSAKEVLTEKRQDLIDYIEENEGEDRSIGEISRELDRDKAAVSRDLELLVKHDIVEYDTEGQRKIPRIKHDTVIVEPVA